jgi:hypothetical protein
MGTRAGFVKVDLELDVRAQWVLPQLKKEGGRQEAQDLPPRKISLAQGVRRDCRR